MFKSTSGPTYQAPPVVVQHPPGSILLNYALQSADILLSPKCVNTQTCIAVC